MDDWDASDSESSSPAPANAVSAKATPLPGQIASTSTQNMFVPSRAGKFAGEDEEEEGDDDWDVSDSEKPKASANATAGSAAPRKKGTLKAKLAEKARLASEGKLNGGDDLIDEMTPQERRRMERELEMEADAKNAADLVGGLALEDTAEPNQLAKVNPKTKEEFAQLAAQIARAMFERLHSKPLYAEFATEIAKQVVAPLRDVDVRKVSAALGVVANEKQKEARDKAAGKKKTAKASKPVLGANKALATKIDTDMYDEALDDGDFM